MFCLQSPMRPNSVTSTLVERQMQCWHAAQARQRAAEPPPACDQPGVLAQARLATSPFLSLRSLRCQGQNGHVTIRGRVPTGYLRDLSDMLVRSIDGVCRVTNEVEVLPLGWASACK
ncbi:MAG TPA: BON domain-containing protein [Pirellulales bacterium]|nr:BON domain-containing protein [Pirellulales bacterium]